MDERNTIIVGTFDDRSAAERAIEQLRDAGFHRDQIGFAGQEAPGDTVLVEEHGNAAGSGAAGGLVTGAVAGGALAWLGLAAIPAIGPFLAGGAIGTALVGAAAGGITGGVLGGLLGLGIPRHKAEYHEQQVRAGRTLVTVQTAEPVIAERIFSAAGAIDIDRGHDDAAASEAGAPTRAFPIDRDVDPSLGDEPMAVPQHELRETDAYREAGVPPTSESDAMAQQREIGSPASRDEVTGVAYDERSDEDAAYDAERERAIREEVRR